MNKIILKTTLSPIGAIMLLTATPAYGKSQTNTTETSTATEFYTQVYDTQKETSTVDTCSELYRKVRFGQAEGAADEEFYKTVMDCYNASIKALTEITKDSPDYEKIKSILRDINPQLQAGAYFYSSADNSAEMTKFAQAYVDTHLLPAFSGEKFAVDESVYPSMIYIAASGAYNNKDYDRAIEYFKAYFSTGEATRREQIYMYMGQACLNTEKYDLAVSTMREAVKAFPENYHLISFGLKASMDGGLGEYIQEFLDKALALKPNDEPLLNIQGKLHEDNQEYLKALEIYNKLDEINPSNLRTARHIALCYYNLGVKHFNDAIMSDDEKTAKRFKRQSNDYFSAASDKLEEVVANDPTSTKYLKALAVSYGCVNNEAKFNEINERLKALGEDPLKSMGMPPLMSYNDNNTLNYSRSGDASGYISVNESGAPLYSEFAKAAVEKKLADWTRKGEFERPDDYQKRVNDNTIRAEYDKACREAESEYLDRYARKLRISDLTLKPYDAANEVYLIESSYGPIYLKVPLANNEAELFKSNWAGVHFRNPKYCIANDEVKVASLTFVTPTGKSYVYDNAEELAYAHTTIDVDFEAILNKANGRDMAARGNKQAENQSQLKVTRQSDVDKDIPVTQTRNASTLALVIANENYSNVPLVESALHDGEVVAEYLQKTLGLPKENIMVRKDVTLGNMLRAVAQVKNTVKSMGEGTDLIVYYAGHGMPDEATKDAFLLPVDGDPMTSESCYSLNRLYTELGNSGADNVIVFLDACFSGAQRGDGMLTSARGVAIKPKEVSPHGNMFILSATSGQETALPYTEKNHGLFTYYLLKKLQQTAGNVTLKELAEDVKTNVSRQSNLINQKPQTPQISLSGEMRQSYSGKKLLKDR